MHIRITTDPISMLEVPDPAMHPCLYEGDGENGLEIYFENEHNMQEYMAWKRDDDSRITLKGDDSEEYVAEG